MERPIIGFEAYSVSDCGFVRVHDRYAPGVHGSKRFLPGRVLRPSTCRNGYKRVGLYQNGQYVMRTVHRLVAQAFLANPNSMFGTIIMHLDGNPANNKATNLRWGTLAENNAMVVQHGRRKLTEAQIRMVRASAATNVALGCELGVSDVMISHVRKRKAYAYIF